MNNIVQSLLQHHKYIFQTSEGGCMLPMSVKEYLESTKCLENITSVLCWDSREIDEVWSIINGWNESAYLIICRSFLNFLDTDIEDTEQFLDLARKDGLSPLEAVNEWFNDEDVKFELVNEQLVVINIVGLANICKVDASLQPKYNDKLVVHLEGGQQVNCFWDTDLVTSLKGLNE